MSAGVLLSYFTIKVSFWLLLLTYGFTFGVGVGIAYVGPLSCAIRWMPRWKGVAGGFIVAGFGLGGLIFDQVQSYYINPHNLKPTDGYFTDHDLLDRVPSVFLILGGTYAVMQFIGSMLIANPPHDFEQLHGQPSASSEPHEDEVDRSDEANLLVRDGKILTGHDQQTPKLIHSGINSPLPAHQHSDSSPSDDDLEDKSFLIPNVVNIQNKYGSIPNRPPPLPLSLIQIELTNVHPFRMLKTFHFYHLWSMMLLGGISVSFIATLFKVFGLTFIDNDEFLATVGSIGALFNCVGRITWGLVADKISYKFAFVLRSGIMTVFLLTFYATSAVGKPMFFVWVCVIFFCVGGIFSIYPTSVAHNYGPKYMSINYGLLFTSHIVSGVTSALLFTTLQNLLGWDGLTFLISGISMGGFLLALLYCFQ